MVWQPEIDEIEKRVELAKKMGGQEGIDVQHGRGKLTIRERLDLFCDRSSFQEIRMSLPDLHHNLRLDGLRSEESRPTTLWGRNSPIRGWPG